MKYEIAFISFLILFNLLSVPCSGDTSCFFTDETTESVEIICDYSSGRDATKSCYSWKYKGSSWNAHKSKIKVLKLNCKGESMNPLFFGAFSNVKELDVSFFDLKSLSSESLNMKYLEKFNMSHNKLPELSRSAFKNLPNLVIADFSFNKISNLDIKTFTIFNKLKILDLSNNMIESIDIDLFKNNNELELLRLDNNPIQSFEFLPNLMKLTSVNITLNHISRLDTSFLGDSLQIEIEDNDEVIFRLPESDSMIILTEESFQRLNYLNVSENQLENMVELIDLLGSSIEILDVSANFMEKLNTETFEKFINLKSLNLKNTNLSTISFEQSQNVSFSTYNTNLLSLNLEDNPIIRFDCNIFTLLKTSVTVQVSCDYIEEIDTSCMGNSIEINFSSENTIFQVLTDYRQYSELNCPKESMKNIKYLNIFSNELENIPQIIDLLGSSIEILDISSNLVRELNADIFEKFINLKYLNVRQTQLSKITSNTPYHLPFYRNDNKLLELYIDQNPIERFDCNLFLLLMSSISTEVSWENVKEIDTSCIGDLLLIDLNEKENEIIFHIPKYNSEFRCLKEHFQKLIYFNISGNHLENTSDVIGWFGPALRILDASSNFIGKLSAGTFKKLNNLQYLNLSNTNLMNFGFSTFYHQNKLITLDLSFNKLSKVDFTLFLRNFKGLATLNLEGNDLMEIDSVTRLNFPKLTSLGISKNRFSCHYLAKFLGRWENLQLFHNPSDQTHIDGVDCFHEDGESKDYERKDEENLMTEKNQLETKTTETLDTVSTVEMVETEKMFENMTTIKIELHTAETHDIFGLSEVNEIATADYRTNNATIGSKSTMNVNASTEKREDIESIQSNGIDKFVTEIPRSSDAFNSILAELRILKYIWCYVLILCTMYFVVKTKLIQRIKQRMTNTQEEEDMIYNDTQSNQHCIELIEQAENTLKRNN